MTPPPVAVGIDLTAMGLLPPDWIEDTLRLADQSALPVHLDGSTPTSLEPDGAKGTDYEVVPGDVIRNRLGWLYELYAGELLHLAAEAIGMELTVSESVRYGVNINRLTGSGARYEWHVDSNPVTGILFVTTLSPDEGGELVLSLAGEEVRISPVAGQFFVFSAGDVPHSVAPLKRDTIRVSIPMSYFRQGEAQIADPALEEYLFGPAPNECLAPQGS